MNQIVKQSPIDQSSLDTEQYFQSLFYEACQKQLLTDMQIERIQMELVELMGKEVERLTNGESSSIRVEKAQALLKSVTYSIGIYLKRMEDTQEALELLKNKRLSELFQQGMDTAAKMKEKAFYLLQNIQKNRILVNNYAYHDTIMNGIPGFFHDYDLEFGADDIPGSIDYPLLCSVSGLLGVEYEYEYLRRLTLENDFLMNFPLENIQELLNSFDPESEHMLVNLFELVFNNVIGCELAGLEIRSLNIPAVEQNLLKNKLMNKTREELKLDFTAAYEAACKELKLSPESLPYAVPALSQLVSRVYHNIQTDTLHKVFLVFYIHVPEEEPYMDGEPMADERLRNLMEELSAVRYTKEKLDKIRAEVRSLYDLTELLDECFDDGEYEQVLNLLSETEKNVLKKRLLLQAGVVEPEEYQPDIKWQKILFDRI